MKESMSKSHTDIVNKSTLEVKTELDLNLEQFSKEVNRDLAEFQKSYNKKVDDIEFKIVRDFANFKFDYLAKCLRDHGPIDPDDQTT